MGRARTDEICRLQELRTDYKRPDLLDRFQQHTHYGFDGNRAAPDCGIVCCGYAQLGLEQVQEHVPHSVFYAEHHLHCCRNAGVQYDVWQQRDGQLVAQHLRRRKRTVQLRLVGSQNRNIVHGHVAVDGL